MNNIFLQQKNYFASQTTKPYAFRRQQLKTLKVAIIENQDRIYEALYKDLHKSRAESLITEVGPTIEELNFNLKKLASWMRPKKVGTPLTLKPAKSFIYSEPLGSILIISPWNYPFLLAMSPLIGAIAAGNCIVIKPSEVASYTSKIIYQIISETFDPQYIKVIEGGIPETTELLKIKFDHIFFTGSTSVGRIVAEAAAKNLVPVTLELGGKSPVIVCEDADLDLAARRITWAKFLNTGQTCVAPDYLYVHENVATELTTLFKNYLVEFLGSDTTKSESFGRIINQNNINRLVKMMGKETVTTSGNYFPPTLLENVDWQSPVMQDEIFGPILPILKFSDYDATLKIIASKEKPLSAYIFTNNKVAQEKFINLLSFGGGCINDCILHLVNPHLPFGGVGASGSGAYHGEKSFRTFSHEKSVLHKSRFFDPRLRYPPYNENKFNLLKRLLGI